MHSGALQRQRRAHLEDTLCGMSVQPQVAAGKGEGEPGLAHPNQCRKEAQSLCGNGGDGGAGGAHLQAAHQHKVGHNVNDGSQCYEVHRGLAVAQTAENTAEGVIADDKGQTQ